VNYLRHAPLTFWVAVCCLGGALLTGAALTGEETAVATPRSAAGASYSRADAVAALDRVSGVYPAVHSGEIRKWAEETELMFTQALDRYLNAGGDKQDPTGQAWQQAIDAAASLAETPSEKRLMQAAVLGQRVHSLVSLTAGIRPEVSNPAGPLQSSSSPNVPKEPRPSAVARASAGAQDAVERTK
jgi:hypothetical protein